MEIIKKQDLITNIVLFGSGGEVGKTIQVIVSGLILMLFMKWLTASESVISSSQFNQSPSLCMQ